HGTSNPICFSSSHCGLHGGRRGRYSHHTAFSIFLGCKRFKNTVLYISKPGTFSLRFFKADNNVGRCRFFNPILYFLPLFTKNSDCHSCLFWRSRFGRSL